jgi:peroxiredoxin Q/BCP
MLKAGEVAPDFKLEDQDGKIWSLGDLRGKKIVLYFYPIDETPGCTKEACDFRDAHNDFADAGYVVLGVSPQDASSHKAFIANHDLNFPLLIDDDLEVAKAYGSVQDAPKEWEGVPLLVKRSTFVIDENGKISEALYGVHAKNHVAELRQTLSV